MKSEFKKIVLENGMTILFERRSLPVVSVAVAVRQGAIHEELSEKGISHFIEHMLYKGTKNRTAKQIAEEIERNGGELNGFTNNLITAYWCRLPSERLEVALDVLSDMVKNPLFDEREVEKERKVILEEIKLYHDNPRFYVFDEIEKCLYAGTLGINVIGTRESVESIDRGMLVKRFNSFYGPKNFILCVVGDAVLDEVIGFAKERFGRGGESADVKEFSFKNEVRVEEREGIDQANLVFAYHVPLADDVKSYAARVLSCLMAEGMSSRLFTEIREKRNLAYAVKGESEITKYYAHNLIYVGTMKQNVEKVKKIILEEFDKVVKGLGEKELEAVKTQLIGNWKLSQEDSVNQMEELIFHEVGLGAENFYDFEKKIKAVSLEDVRDLAGRAKEKFSFFALVPKERD